MKTNATQGIPAELETAMKRAFKNVEFPTKSQIKMLKALSEGKSFIMRSLTGSGKSFALTMHMLSVSLDKEADGFVLNNHTNSDSICIVPGPDLADQYYLWISKIASKMNVSADEMPRLVQVLYRAEKEEEEEQLNLLKKYKNPHIIIATPNRILDLLQNQDTRHIINFENIKVLAIDEADAVIEPPEINKEAKGKKKGKRHVPSGEKCINYIVRCHQFANAKKKGILPEELGESKEDQKIGESNDLQLIAVSATANSALRNFIQHKNWTGTGVRDKKTRKPYGSLGLDKDKNTLDIRRIPENISHYVVRVTQSDEDTLVIEDEKLPEYDASVFLADAPIEPKRHVQFEKDEKASGYPAAYLSIVALIRLIESEKVKQGIVFIPHGASRQSFIWACNYLGLHSVRELRVKDVMEGEVENNIVNNEKKKNEPVIFIAHTQSARGIDLPSLSHAFVMGGDSFGGREYIHMAGRVGRAGKHGKVFTILCAENEHQKEASVQADWVSRKLYRVGVVPKKWKKRLVTKIPTVE